VTEWPVGTGKWELVGNGSTESAHATTLLNFTGNSDIGTRLMFFTSWPDFMRV
jgi:hypothetical protein